VKKEAALPDRILTPIGRREVRGGGKKLGMARRGSGAGEKSLSKRKKRKKRQLETLIVGF